MKKPILMVVGTRPGAIKLLPLYLALKNAHIPTVLCATFQHDQLLQQVLDIFQVTPDINLNIMKKNQDLFYLTTEIITKIQAVYLNVNPELVIVHGDTTTAFAASLAAFYLKIPIGHLEAGLRTGNIYAPFPEEINRKFISNVAALHFAPTSLNVANLLSEGIKRETIFCTGNVVVDALQFIKQKIDHGTLTIDPALQAQVAACKRKNQKIVLLTAHRRESFSHGLTRIFKSVKKFAQNRDDIFFFYPAHPNPHVLAAIEESGIKTMSNLFCSSPLVYKDLLYLLFSADWVMTDSGGIQEEAMSIGKKVLILRDVTERMEGVWEGLGFLVGTNETLIMASMQKLYEEKQGNPQSNTIYGDGNSCMRIVSILKNNQEYKDLVIAQALEKPLSTCIT